MNTIDILSDILDNQKIENPSDLFQMADDWRIQQLFEQFSEDICS
jgi:hypothetical protein